MERSKMQYRTVQSDLKTRAEEENSLVIEGYFAVFNSTYDMGLGMSESIAPGAFSDTLAGDIRALIDHETRLVLGRTTAHTLELLEDSHGLWGRIHINPQDSEAMNLYARVKRGDVSQCSIGCYIEQEEATFPADGMVHWTIQKINLFEVSCCTFPAYEETGIAARKRDKEQIEARKMQAWKASMQARLKGERESC